jgi:RNA polymerase sigma factor (sigma-70 family)
MGENLFINQLLSGDRKALEIFVNDNRHKIFRICLAYVQNEHNASDLTQEVFIKALEKLHQYKGDSKISTWLTRIAINLSLNYLRDNKKRLQQVGLESFDFESNQPNKLLSGEVKQMVRKAIYKLPEKQRKVFILSFYLDLSYAEIGEITAMTISSIESLLFRARKNLRSYLQKFYDEIKL